MPILVYGLNHKTAALDLRGRLAFSPDEIKSSLSALQGALPELREVAMLVTCNRTEIHGYSHSVSTEDIRDWLAQNRKVSTKELDLATFALFDDDAVRHIIEVAAGLDSQIMGETQIHGQFKDAYRMAESAGTLGKELSLVHEFTLQTAKRIRTETNLGAKKASVANATIAMATQIFADLQHINVLLIGAGTNIQLIAKLLQGEDARQITYANRTRANAEKLAQEVQGRVISLDDISTELENFDMVVSSTASPSYVLLASEVEEAAQKRRRKPMFMADLAVPRDIDPQVNEFRDIYLYSVDDLSSIVSQSSEERKQLQLKAQELVKDGLLCYQKKHRIQLSSSLLKAYRTQVEDVREVALNKALQKLRAGESGEEVLANLAKDLVNQLAHTPTVTLRNASAMEDGELLKLLQESFDLKSS